jgi:hypothetical protein
MYVDVTIEPPSTVQVSEVENPYQLIVRVRGRGEHADLCRVLAAESAGIPYGHEAAIGVDWIRRKAVEEGNPLSHEHFGRLVKDAEARGLLDEEGGWIFMTIVWEDDLRPHDGRCL